MNSIKAALFGFVVVFAGIVLLFWNEGRTVKEARALAEGAGLVVSVAADRVDPALDGKLVHVSGDVRAGAALQDGDFGVSATGLRLTRRVEMMQWREERRSKGQGQEDEYNYVREWSETPVDSSRFRYAADHRNPPWPAVGQRDLFARDARLGAFAFGEPLIRQIGSGEAHSVDQAAAQRARQLFGRQAVAIQGGLFVGQDASQPRIGDLRVSWEVVPAQTVSLVGRQGAGTLAAYRASNGNEILLVRRGSLDARAMFDAAQSDNATLGWVLRFVGVIVVFAGWRLIFGPIEALASYVPILNVVVSFGVSLAAWVLTLLTAPFVMAIAWFWYRPLLSLSIFGGGALGAAAIVAMRRAGVLRPKGAAAPAAS